MLTMMMFSHRVYKVTKVIQDQLVLREIEVTEESLEPQVPLDPLALKDQMESRVYQVLMDGQVQRVNAALLVHLVFRELLDLM